MWKKKSKEDTPPERPNAEYVFLLRGWHHYLIYLIWGWLYTSIHLIWDGIISFILTSLSMASFLWTTTDLYPCPSCRLSDSGHTSSFASEDELGFSSDSEAENIFMYDSFIDPHLESEDELDCLRYLSWLCRNIYYSNTINAAQAHTYHKNWKSILWSYCLVKRQYYRRRK